MNETRHCRIELSGQVIVYDSFFYTAGTLSIAQQSPRSYGKVICFKMLNEPFWISRVFLISNKYMQCHYIRIQRRCAK